MKKGLRLGRLDDLLAHPPLETSPDEEGIKTLVDRSTVLKTCALETSPDEEGIKTIPVVLFAVGVRFGDKP